MKYISLEADKILDKYVNKYRNDVSEIMWNLIDEHDSVEIEDVDKAVEQLKIQEKCKN